VLLALVVLAGAGDELEDPPSEPVEVEPLDSDDELLEDEPVELVDEVPRLSVL
jgi:hypothetical protein